MIHYWKKSKKKSKFRYKYGNLWRLMKLNEIKRIPENKFICFKVRVIKRLAFINFFIKKGLCNSIKV
jgi:hypothetical protein